MGQDVLLGDKFLEVCRIIDCKVMVPKFIVLLYSEIFFKSESFQFSIDLSIIHREVELNPSNYTYEYILIQHKSHYISILVQVLWNVEQEKGDTFSEN